ncbi:MAG: hypothetical protein KGI04_00255 [Candidatus Micrarchaeota archaeon]|nr:hypothetical protein [Candidatus Micrarchaeota archaeon]
MGKSTLIGAAVAAVIVIGVILYAAVGNGGKGTGTPNAIGALNATTSAAPQNQTSGQKSEPAACASQNLTPEQCTSYCNSNPAACESNGSGGQSVQGNSTGNYTVGQPKNSTGGLRDYSLPACGSSKTYFSTTPISENNFTAFAPLGWMSPGGHVIPVNHGAFYLRVASQQSQDNFTTANVSVLSPGNVTVFEIVGQQYLGSGQPSDYAIYFSPCANVTFYFGHVQVLAPELANNYTAPFANCMNTTANTAQLRVCQKQMSVKLHTGELIGYIGGHPTGGGGGVAAMDLGVYDYLNPALGFANQSRYDIDELHAACPIDYFTASAQSYLYAHIGIANISGTAQPACGTNMRDIAGSAQGNWFSKGTPVPYINEGLLMSLSPFVLSPNLDVFSVGSTAGVPGLAGVTYYFTPAGSGNVNTAFSGVAANGQIHCYSALNDSYDVSQYSQVSGRILLQLVNSSAVRIEYQNTNGCGSGPWSFTQNSAELYR